jgi:hypothetical protein
VVRWETPELARVKLCLRFLFLASKFGSGSGSPAAFPQEKDAQIAEAMWVRTSNAEAHDH